MEMQFVFRRGDFVELRRDPPFVDLKAGDVGVVNDMLRLNKPAYDVRFRSPDGTVVVLVLFQEDLAKVEADYPPFDLDDGEQIIGADIAG